MRWRRNWGSVRGTANPSLWQSGCTAATDWPGWTVPDLLTAWRGLETVTAAPMQAWRSHIDMIDHLLEVMRRAAADARLSQAPRTLVHADFWALNLGWSDDGIAAIYDLDDGHRDLVVHDVATLLMRSCVPRAGGVDAALARRMLRQYRQVRPLPDDEWRHAVAAGIAKECWYILPGLAMQWEEPQADHTAVRLNRVQRCLWLLA